MSKPRVLLFGDFELDPVSVELSRRGRPLTLGLRPASLLLELVRERHRTVAKAELIASVWAGVQVSEASLTTAVRLIRRALGDSTRNPRYIRTSFGRGYRFIAPVREGASGTSIGQTGPSAKPHLQTQQAYGALPVEI